MRTCKCCKNKKPANWMEFIGSYCKDCYYNTPSRFKRGDVVNFINSKQIKGTRYQEAFIDVGQIFAIRKVNKPISNGLYEYTITTPNSRIIKYRFEKDIAYNRKDLLQRVEDINYVRQSNREMRRNLNR